MRVRTFFSRAAAVLTLFVLPTLAARPVVDGYGERHRDRRRGRRRPGRQRHAREPGHEHPCHARDQCTTATSCSSTRGRGPTSSPIELTGFATTKVAAFVVGVNETVARNVALKVGAVEENVEVVAQSELLQGSTSELGNVIEEKVIKDMPLQGRNFTQLLVLTPGVNPVSTAQGPGPERRRLDRDQQLRRQLGNPGRLLHERLDPGPAEPLEDLLRRRDREHERAVGQLRGAARHRLAAGVQGPVARRQGRVRRRHRRRRQHDLEVRQQRLPRHGLRVLPQRRARRAQLLPRRGGRQCRSRPRSSARASSASTSAARSSRTRRSSSPPTTAGATARWPRSGTSCL